VQQRLSWSGRFSSAPACAIVESAHWTFEIQMSCSPTAR
jgi:hypothetical protein